MSKKTAVKAYGKFNLYLDITGVREDGYHLLKTVMQSVSVYDVLEFEMTEGTGIELNCDNENFPKDSRNLIWKAIEAFYEYADIMAKQKIIVNVIKNIPQMAGMAGGSADCAATLIAMNKLYNTNYSIEELCKIGLKLGADVPFTLVGGTVLCEGIGEKMTKIVSVPKMYFAAVQPDVKISTPQAYKTYDNAEISNKKSYNDFEKALKNQSVDKISESIYNVFDVVTEHEDIMKAKKQMLDNGALSSMMTGSGSVVFGIFNNKEKAQKCINNMDEYSYKEVLTPVSKGWEIIE